MVSLVGLSTSLSNQSAESGTGFRRLSSQQDLSHQVLKQNQAQQQQVHQQSLPEAKTEEAPKQDSIRVTSTLGKSASSGQLSRKEAVAIYQEIANLL